MKILQEITEWDDPIPNHVYLLNDSRDRMLAYVRAGTDDLKVFSKPLGFSTRGRKFVEVANRWGWQPESVVPKNTRAWSVPGSRGAVYTVSETQGRLSCTCPAFRFKGGHCKHLSVINTEQEELNT